MDILASPFEVAALVQAERDRFLHTLFRRNCDFVYRSLRGLGVSEADADDLVQEVFLVVHRKLDQYDDRGHGRAWLYAVCRRVASTHRRSRRRGAAREQRADTPRDSEDPERQLANRQAVARVGRVLDLLRPERREVFVLIQVEGLSAPEVAAALGLKVNTVYSRLRLARRDFAQLMQTGCGNEHTQSD